MFKSFITLCLAMVFAGIGNIFFGKGMKRIGALDRYYPKSVALFFGKAIVNGYIWLGIIMSAIYFFLWLVILSWADVSWALPMNGVEYLFVAAASVFYLKEKLDSNRIAGIGLIVLGILFLMRSWN